MKDQTTINCPDCGNSIDVNDIIKHQLEEGIKKEYQEKLNQSQIEIKKQKEKLDVDRQEFLAKKEKENELFLDRLADEKKKVAIEIEKKLTKRLNSENEDRLKSMEKELAQKSEQVKELHRKEAEISKLKREKDEAVEAAKAEQQKELNNLLREERQKISKKVEDENELKLKELHKQLEDQKKLTEEMKRKQEQGSMQLQGEVQELAMEDWLESNFPLDTIDEIKKGANGADCLQIVNTREQTGCGTIYYESKRAKNFSRTWVEKFKDDLRQKNANIGVIVTQVLPNGMDRMGMIDKNIWVCTYPEFKGLSAALRQTIINVSNAVITQANKGDKMSMLYDYLTSPEFRMQIEAIKDAFIDMQTDLNKEKVSTQTRWKRRQKQIDKVILNTTGMYGSIRGIAGNAVPLITDLEEDIDDEKKY